MSCNYKKRPRNHCVRTWSRQKSHESTASKAPHRTGSLCAWLSPLEMRFGKAFFTKHMAHDLDDRSLALLCRDGTQLPHEAGANTTGTYKTGVGPLCSANCELTRILSTYPAGLVTVAYTIITIERALGHFIVTRPNTEIWWANPFILQQREFEPCRMTWRDCGDVDELQAPLQSLHQWGTASADRNTQSHHHAHLKNLVY